MALRDETLNRQVEQRAANVVNGVGEAIVVAKLQSAPVDSTGAAIVYKTAFVNANTAGYTTVVAGVAQKRIQVLYYLVSLVGGAVTWYLASASTALTSSKISSVAADAPQGAYLIQTAVGEALRVNLSGAVAVGIDVVYREV